MAECRNNGNPNARERDMVCIDTYRILDSCRDKDCFEDVRVYLTDCGQEIINRTNAVRAKSAKVVWSAIDIDTVPFNRGFYQLYIRIYVKITCEACIGPGNMTEFEGIAAVEKKVILYGGEGNINVFKSDHQSDGFCGCGRKLAIPSTTLPVAVLETVDPIVLGTKIAEPHKPCKCCCCSSVDEIPDRVYACVNEDLTDDPDSNLLLVSLGLFSVVRIERPAQLLVNAVDYAVPEKECVIPTVEDPCSLFRQMAFPSAEFSSVSHLPGLCENERKCGCQS